MRSKEITKQYLQFLDRHIEAVADGTTAEMLPLSEIASLLFISSRHLSDTIRKETGHAPSHFYNLKIIEKAKKLIDRSQGPIAEVAYQLTFDPSNFTKVFKKVAGITPGAYQRYTRNAILNMVTHQSSGSNPGLPKQACNSTIGLPPVTGL
ncbi:AraC family transcriptional regulator [Niabella sp.]|uniref:helix-turn-helix domain-containing protein n=1 Tax=Niabella sp. TaxID=1962976 RepID=UPI00261BD20D|nr:AraC family transcriptional regulator [Niabella sp.]